MALFSCRDCGRHVSDAAAVCPNCGCPTSPPPPSAPSPKKRNRFLYALKWVAGVWVVLTVIGTWSAMSGPSSSLEADLKAAAKRPIYDTTGARSLRQLRAADPWIVRPLDSRMTGHEGMIARVRSPDAAQGVVGAVRPELAIQCFENRTSVFLDTEAPLDPELGGRYTIHIRFGDRPRGSQSWSEGTSMGHYFAPSAIALARRLVAADTVRVQYTPYNEAPQVVRFPLHGLRPHLTELARLCGWTL